MKKLLIIPILLLSTLCNAQFTKGGGQFLKTGSGFMTEQSAPFIEDYPEVLSGTTTDRQANVSTLTVTMPTGLQSGELILVVTSTPFGRNLVVDEAVSGTDWNIETEEITEGGLSSAVLWKIATGSDALKLNLMLSGSSSTSNLRTAAYRISGARTDNPITVTSNKATASSSTTLNWQPNSGEYGESKYLWLLAAAVIGVTSATPTDFGDHDVHGTSGEDIIETFRRDYEYDGSYDPASVAKANGRYIAHTIIINPTNE